MNRQPDYYEDFPIKLFTGLKERTTTNEFLTLIGCKPDLWTEAKKRYDKYLPSKLGKIESVWLDYAWIQIVPVFRDIDRPYFICREWLAPLLCAYGNIA